MGSVQLECVVSLCYVAAIIAFPVQTQENLKCNCSKDNPTARTVVQFKYDGSTYNRSTGSIAGKSYEELLARLHWLLGSPAPGNVTLEREEFESALSHIAKIPQNILSDVAAERLLELFVTRRTNKSKIWNRTLNALGYLEESKPKNWERDKSITKRSSDSPRRKFKRSRRRHAGIAGERRNARRGRRARRRHKVKQKWRSKHYYGKYRYNVTHPYKKVRHNTVPSYGVYTPESLYSLLERPSYYRPHNNGSEIHSKIEELRRWGQNYHSQNSENWKSDNEVENRWQQVAGHADKAALLASNTWPHFAYHRVTSSPTLHKRQRSAYVAVSLLPDNATR